MARQPGQGIKDPRKLRRIIKRTENTGKLQIVRMMQELTPGLTAREAGRMWDKVTEGMNAWIMTRTRDLPKGTHARLMVTNCFSINLCWCRSTGQWPDFPRAWVQLSGGWKRPGPREQFRRMKLREYARWKAEQEAKPLPQGEQPRRIPAKMGRAYTRPEFHIEDD